MGKFIDLRGKRFGNLTVLIKLNSDRGGVSWLCQCDCGDTRVAYSSELNRGLRCRTCLHCARIAVVEAHKTHGRSYSNIYKIWQGIIQRCYNERNSNYKTYGAVGVKVCPEWLSSPETFIKWAEGEGYRKGLTIDRKDVTGDYTPTNCRFITRSENSKGLRRWQIVNRMST